MKAFSGKRYLKEYFILTILLVISVLLSVVFNYIFQQLISVSNISFEPYKVLDLSVYSLIGITSVILLFLLPVFFMFKIISVIQDLKPVAVIFPVLTSSLLFVIFYFYGFSPHTCAFPCSGMYYLRQSGLDSGEKQANSI